jgi:hypothetical protein
MRSRRRATIEDLRAAIQALPRTTRIAMLEGIRANEIIVGAYTDGHGICPMLAAHRNGGRTNLISFAKAWDRFALGGTGGARVTKPRPATTRELLVLRAHLEASLLDDEAPQDDLAAAIHEHSVLVARREEWREAEARREVQARRQAQRQQPRRERPRREHPRRHDSRLTAASPRPGDRDRSNELRSRGGWSWTRLVRRYDEYQWALEQVRSHERAQAQDEARDGRRPVGV